MGNISNGTGSVVRSAINNSLVSYSDSYSLELQQIYQQNIYDIAYCQAAEGWVNSSWDGVSGTVANDTANYKIGTQGISVTATANDGSGGHLVKAMDMSYFNDGNSSSEPTDYIQFGIYITAAEINKLATGLKLRFLCDTAPTITNYFSYTIAKESLSNGYNFFSLAKSAFSSVGSPTWATVKGIDIIHVGVPTAGAVFTFIYCQQTRKDPSTYSANPFQKLVNHSWTRDFVINAGKWFVGMESGKIVCRDLSPEVSNNAILGTLPFNDFDIAMTVVCKMATHAYGPSWYIDENNYITTYIDSNTLYLAKKVGGANTFTSTSLTAVIGDVITYRLNKNGSSVTLIVTKNGDNGLELNLDVALALGGYLGVVTAVDRSFNVESMGITKVSFANRAAKADTIGDISKTSLMQLVQRVPARQTVLLGKVDDNGYASFLSPGSGLTVTGSASAAEPIIAAFANGFNDYSDYVVKITENVSWTGLPANLTSFLYIDRDISNGAISYGYAPTPCQYNYTFDRTQNSLIHFENATTTILDEYGNSWSCFSHATQSNAQYKFGSRSLSLPGTDDYIENTSIVSLGGGGWTIEGYFQFNAIAANQTIIGSKNQYGLRLVFNGTSKKLNLYLSSNGTSFDIANGTAGTTSISANTWYHFSINYDGTNYKVYLKDSGATVLEINVASSAKVCIITGLRIGADHNGAVGMTGYFDEFRLTIGNNRYGDVYTVPATAYAPDAHWFDLVNMKMKYGSPTSWAEVVRVFLAECLAGASFISSVIIYAINGIYESEVFTITTNNTYVKYAKIGVPGDQTDITCLIRENANYNWIESQSIDRNEAANQSGTCVARVGRNTIMVVTASNSVNGYLRDNTGAFSGALKTAGECKVSVKRRF